MSRIHWIIIIIILTGINCVKLTFRFLPLDTTWLSTIRYLSSLWFIILNYSCINLFCTCLVSSKVDGFLLWFMLRLLFLSRLYLLLIFWIFAVTYCLWFISVRGTSSCLRFVKSLMLMLYSVKLLLLLLLLLPHFSITQKLRIIIIINKFPIRH